MQASPLFRKHKFIASSTKDTVAKYSAQLDSYLDTQGPAWFEPGRAKGGSKIFENQSNCAFKAFVTHQFTFQSEDETEFGLDGLDRGNIVHHLLDRLWQALQTQAQLLKLDVDARATLVSDLVVRTLSDGSLKLGSDKLNLLRHEQQRLENLLLSWLEIEAQRPMGFSVVEREERRHGECAGIQFSYIIDRVDLTDDGRSIIIDYKTGLVNRNDWLGKRIKRPQLPLYALALDEQKRTPSSGIAYAQLKQGDSKFIELAETDIVRKETKRSTTVAAQWAESRAGWPTTFIQLAEDFLAGKAVVNPIDKNTCQYCELHAVCRVAQLRSYPVDPGQSDGVK